MMMNYETYRIEKYDMCRDDSHAVIACYEYENENEDKKILRLLIRGNSLIPTPSNEINDERNNMYAILNTTVGQIPDFLNMLDRESELYLLIETTNKKIMLSSISYPNNDLHKSFGFYP